MVNSPKTKRSASMPAQAMSLAHDCPDLSQWPQRWQCDTPDIAMGERIVEHFMVFLPHRLPSGRARNITFRSTLATPLTLARTVRVTLADGGTSYLPTKTINVVV